MERVDPRDLLVTIPDHPIAIEPLGEGRWLCDFGHVAFAGLELGLPAAAFPLTARLGERRLPDGGVDLEPAGSLRAEDLLCAASGAAPIPTWSPPRWADPTHHVQLRHDVMPFRWVELVGLDTSPEPTAITRHRLQLPIADRAADFRCSDAGLETVWELCKRTIGVTSYCGYHVDGERERRPYEADAYINQLGWYAISNDPRPTRESILFLLDKPTWPTEWQYHLVLLVENDWLQSGDTGLLEERFDEIAACAQVLEPGDDGLVRSLGAWNSRRQVLADIVDWPAGERDGFDFRLANSVVNAYAFRALSALARMAEAIGRDEQAAKASESAAAIRRGFHRLLIDHHSGLVRDGLGPRLRPYRGHFWQAVDNETAPSEHCGHHAQLFALAGGLLDREQRRPLVERLRADGLRCSVYAAQFLLEGLYAAGAGDLAYALMSGSGERSWRHMIDDLDASLTLEAWDPRFKPNLDWNHAWGAAPANQIPRRLVGIRPIAPGWSRCTIDPQPGPLAWFAARIPTPQGPIDCRYEAADGSLQLSLPDGIDGVFRGRELPPGEHRLSLS